VARPEGTAREQGLHNGHATKISEHYGESLRSVLGQSHGITRSHGGVLLDYSFPTRNLSPAARVTKRLWEIGDIVDVLEAWEAAN
jgi:hypothetical protein